MTSWKPAEISITWNQKPIEPTTQTKRPSKERTTLKSSTLGTMPSNQHPSVQLIKHKASILERRSNNSVTYPNQDTNNNQSSTYWLQAKMYPRRLKGMLLNWNRLQKEDPTIGITPPLRRTRISAPIPARGTMKIANTLLNILKLADSKGRKETECGMGSVSSTTMKVVCMMATGEII